MRIDYGSGSGPFGRVFMAASRRGIMGMAFVASGAERAALARLRAEWPKAVFRRASRRIAVLRDAVFSDRARGRALRIYVRGSPFQLRVWRELLSVPAGRPISYGGLAEAVGQAGAARAVGNAVADNPVAYLIPCHRVVRASGAPGEYRWGGDRKRMLLRREAAGRRHGPYGAA